MGKGCSQGQKDGTGSQEHSHGGLWPSVLYPTLCACQHSPKPSVLGLDFGKPVRRLGGGDVKIS